MGKDVLGVIWQGNQEKWRFEDRESFGCATMAETVKRQMRRERKPLEQFLYHTKMVNHLFKWSGSNFPETNGWETVKGYPFNG